MKGAERPRVAGMTVADVFEAGSAWKGRSNAAEFTLAVPEHQEGRSKAKFESRNREKVVSEPRPATPERLE